MQLPEILIKSPDGEIRLAGHRIDLYHIVQRYNDGESAEMLAARYPTLPLSLVHKVLAFYLENQSEVDAYVATCSAAIDEQQRSARRLDLGALRRRLAAQQPPATEAQVGSPMALAILLDEHLRGPLWQAILRHNLRGEYPLDVVRLGDMADLPLSADDSEILLWAEREGRILLTEDRHTIALHLRHHLASGHHCPGILIPRSGQSMPALVDCLVLIAHAGQPADFADTITYIP